MGANEERTRSVTRPREGRNRRHEAVFNPFHVVFRRVSVGSQGGDWPWARPSSATSPPSRSRITIWCGTTDNTAKRGKMRLVSYCRRRVSSRWGYAISYLVLRTARRIRDVTELRLPQYRADAVGQEHIRNNWAILLNDRQGRSRDGMEWLHFPGYLFHWPAGPFTLQRPQLPSGRSGR